ncbi:hypothetical protein ACQEVB_31745 [Pseudonocardia sp. CA-107938]|uniref:hypothetical protein n=1 Tax=Pseudonocardia sp. CA-107938 TaxID=3240021 RepID=UPI003D8DBDB4
MIATHLAPFIAWLATREPDAELRRRYREHVQSYLSFAAAHGGPSERNHLAWDATLPQLDWLRAERATAISRFVEHCTIIERTRIPT